MNLISKVKHVFRKAFKGPITSGMVDDILEGNHIAALAMDPGAAVAAFNYDGTEYRVFDSYCLNPDCDCAQVGLHFVPVDAEPTNGEHSVDFDEVIFLFYDYETQVMSVAESKVLKKQRKLIWRAFRDQCGDMLLSYKTRHAEYRQLVSKWLPRVLRREEKKVQEVIKRLDQESEYDAHQLLQAVLDETGMNIERLSIALPSSDGADIHIEDRHCICLHDGDKTEAWHVDCLSALFRGEADAPSFGDMEYYPDEYQAFFYDIERHIVMLADLDPPPTDEQFNEAYSMMRRRPDGRSVGALHDIVWQAACLALALRPWSANEYEAVFRQLARSARTFRMGPSSRNYMAYLSAAFTEESK